MKAGRTKTLEAIVGKLLKQHKASLSIAESCTGGFIAGRITNVPGSSGYFYGAIVCYSNEAKEKLLGMPKKLLKQYGAVSPEVARAMAVSIQRISRTTIGLGITGIAGPGGGTAKKPVGTVFIAIADKNGATSRGYFFKGNRKKVRTLSTDMALKQIIQYFSERGRRYVGADPCVCPYLSGRNIGSPLLV